MRFIAWKNGKTIAIRNHINLMKSEILLLPISFLLFTIPMSSVIDNPCKGNIILFIVLSIISLFFILLPFIVLLFEKYDDKIFLQNTKKKYIIEYKDGFFYKDKIKFNLNMKSIAYLYKNFIFLTTHKKSDFIIYNDSFEEGSREELIELLKSLIIIKKGF